MTVTSTEIVSATIKVHHAEKYVVTLKDNLNAEATLTFNDASSTRGYLAGLLEQYPDITPLWDFTR